MYGFAFLLLRPSDAVYHTTLVPLQNFPKLPLRPSVPLARENTHIHTHPHPLSQTHTHTHMH